MALKSKVRGTHTATDQPAQIGHVVPPVVIGAFVALLRRSLAAAIHRRRTCSKFLAALWTVARHPDLLAD